VSGYEAESIKNTFKLQVRKNHADYDAQSSPQGMALKISLFKWAPSRLPL